jgi:hypothetical protein
VSAGHTSVKNFFAATGGVTGGNVQPSFFEHAGPWVVSVPSSNPLLFAGDISGDFGVQLRCHVPHPVVSRHTRGANVALETVFASTVQGHSANRSILGTVLAESSSKAHIQTKAVSQHCQEVLLRHSFGHDIFPEDGGFQEPSGARTSSTAKVDLVVWA